GFALGITAFSSLSTKASEKMGLDSMKTLQKTMSTSGLDLDKLDIQPVVRPVVDLSNVDKASNQISTMMSNSGTLTPSVSMDYATMVAAQQAIDIRNPNDEMVMNPEAAVAKQVNYTQNIYSPKAISEAEVYRQTNNQLSKIKEGLRK